MSLPIGKGDTGTASITETVLTLGNSGDYAKKCSVRNNGSNIIHALVNCSASTLETEYAAGRTIAIPGSGNSFLFESEGAGEIHSVAYRTDTGTSGFYIAAY